jgi:hypothetical protein
VEKTTFMVVARARSYERERNERDLIKVCRIYIYSSLGALFWN